MNCYFKQNPVSNLEVFLNLRILILLVLYSLPYNIHAEEAIITKNCEIIIDDFKAGIAPGWSEKSFNGKTQYSINTEGEQSYLRANSNSSASGLYYKIKFDPREYPFIFWKWRVNNILKMVHGFQLIEHRYSW